MIQKHRPKLGLVTIGQAPRTDVLPDILPVLSEVDIVEHGALDPLGEHPEANALALLAPAPGESPLTSRLRSSVTVILGYRAVETLLADAIQRAEEDGVDATVLLCTGHFAELPSRRPLLTANQLIHHGVAALTAGQRVGVVCPLPDQVDECQRQWRTVLGQVDVVAASPYTNGEAAVAKAARSLADQGSTVIVLDCIGYTERMRMASAQACGLPVLLARTIVARLAAEFITAAAV